MGGTQFSSVKAATSTVERDVEVAYQIKSNHGLFPKQFIEDSLKDALGDFDVTLEGKHSSRAHLVAIGCQHNLKVTLSFIISKNAGSTRKGSPCKMKFLDSYGNAHSRLVDLLSVISDFFQSIKHCRQNN